MKPVKRLPTYPSSNLLVGQLELWTLNVASNRSGPALAAGRSAHVQPGSNVTAETFLQMFYFTCNHGLRLDKMTYRWQCCSWLRPADRFRHPRPSLWLHENPTRTHHHSASTCISCSSSLGTQSFDYCNAVLYGVTELELLSSKFLLSPVRV